MVCENRLYNISVLKRLYSYDPVTKFVLSPLNKCDPEKEGTGGLGESKDIFIQYCDIEFEVTEQGGSNVSYLYHFGYDDARAIQYNPDENIGKTLHRYKLLLNLCSFITAIL